MSKTNKMDGWMSGWMDGWMDRGTDGWMTDTGNYQDLSVDE